MLKLNNMEAIAHVEIENILVQFRPVQVSRFPINVHVNQTGDMIRFEDSRYPCDNFRVDSNLAILFFKGNDDKTGKKMFTIESRLIQNDKFSSVNSDYHTKTTSDTRKLFKLVREYVKPYSGMELALRTLRTAEASFDAWRTEPMRNSRESVSDLYRDDLLEIFASLKALGVTAVHAKMQRVYDQAVPAYLEGKERTNNKFAGVHVTFNPDDSVIVTCMREDVENNITKGSVTHESLEVCPAFIQEQVAMLRLIESKTHLPNVGTKVDDKTFWIDTIHK